MEEIGRNCKTLEQSRVNKIQDHICRLRNKNSSWKEVGPLSPRQLNSWCYKSWIAMMNGNEAAGNEEGRFQDHRKFSHMCFALNAGLLLHNLHIICIEISFNAFCIIVESGPAHCGPFSATFTFGK